MISEFKINSMISVQIHGHKWKRDADLFGLEDNLHLGALRGDEGGRLDDDARQLLRGRHRRSGRNVQLRRWHVHGVAQFALR